MWALRLAEFVRTIDSPGASYLASNAVFTKADMAAALASEARAALGGLLAPGEADREFFHGMREGNFLNHELRFEIETRLWADLLAKLDNASMPFALEGRVPFLDHRLVEFSARIPPGLKIRFAREKWILRRAALSSLPERIVRRKKEHFFVPIDTWLREDLADFVRARLDPAYLRHQGLFDPEFIRRIDEGYHDGALVHARQLWNLVCFQTWYAEYMENESGLLDRKADQAFEPKVTHAHQTDAA